MDPPDLDRYYLKLGAAFVRGRLGEALSEDARRSDERTFRAGVAHGLRLHKFKRRDDSATASSAMLPRVRRVLSMLTALSPVSLLDVGSGRGAFLWPLLDTFADLEVTAIDFDEQRAADLAALHRGGFERLRSAKMDAQAMTFDSDTFDGVTMLEVLEHMPAPRDAAREALRVGARFVIASVPSKPDDNPEHIHTFDTASFTELFRDAGARRVAIEHVPGHMIALALR